jgi:hypothetical protein
MSAGYIPVEREANHFFQEDNHVFLEDIAGSIPAASTAKGSQMGALFRGAAVAVRLLAASLVAPNSSELGSQLLAQQRGGNRAPRSFGHACERARA